MPVPGTKGGVSGRRKEWNQVFSLVTTVTAATAAAARLTFSSWQRWAEWCWYSSVADLTSRAAAAGDWGRKTSLETLKASGVNRQTSIKNLHVYMPACVWREGGNAEERDKEEKHRGRRKVKGGSTREMGGFGKEIKS